MSANNKINLIPEVSEISLIDSIFTLTAETKIGVDRENLLSKARLLAGYLRPATGFDLPCSVDSDCEIYLTLRGDGAEESYGIEVSGEKCLINAPDEAGLARAIQAFRQLLPPAIFSDKKQRNTKWTIPGCRISDSPRFSWRGMHLDVSRHFFPKEEVMRFIDLIALYRYNRFHLHLTDDQGWRIEIKKYPKLTEIGAFRESTLIGHAQDRPKKYDDIPYGGYYTRQDIREIIAFAEDREITIIPEIDMPGHMQAAISAYPELGCTDRKLRPLCHWGICEHILNVEESTIAFMKDVLDEIMELFPGPWIHIGGDEALKYEWEEERRIQDRMDELGLKSEMELQSWFIRQMTEHIHSKGRKAIGWDEVLEGGLADGIIVMSWRGEKGGINAVSMGHQVIMTPEDHLYFDHYQGDKENEPLAIHGFTPLEKVYTYEVIPEEVSDERKDLILGSQGQIWTEYISDFKHLEYMTFPRVCALSEALWTTADKKNRELFLKKMERHYEILTNLGVNFRKPS